MDTVWAIVIAIVIIAIIAGIVILIVYLYKKQQTTEELSKQITDLTGQLNALTKIMKIYINNKSKSVSEIISAINADTDATGAYKVLYANIIEKEYKIPQSIQLEIDKERVVILTKLEPLLIKQQKNS